MPTELSDENDRASSVSPPSFVGRRQELAVLAQALARPPALVLVEGEPGIGKSRLVRELLSSPAHAPRGLAVAAACPPLPEPYTLGPVVEAVRQATDRVTGLRLTDLAGALRPLFPEWAGDLPEAPEPAEDARAARHRLFRALTELLGCLDVAVLVVEDVHWADEATLEFLLFVASLQAPPISLVVTYRPDEVPGGSLLLRLSSRPPTGTTRTRLTLGPLDVAETASLMSSMLGGEPVSAEFAAFLFERTDGVPLAVEESLRLMYDRADVARYDGSWVRRPLEDIDVPPTVRDAVSERTARLDPDALVMLRAASVLAAKADEATLAAVSALAADRSAVGLAEALGCGLLEEDGRGRMSFRHGLASRAVYEAIPGPQRRAMHLRAGRALEELHPPPVARLARHFREAGDSEGWVCYAEQAADAAAAAGDGAGAEALLHDLLSSADLPAAAVAPLAAKIPQGSLAGTSRIHEVAAALRAALESGALDARQKAVTRYQLGVLLEAMDDYDGSRLEIELAVPHLASGSQELLDAMMLLGWPRGSIHPGRVHRDWLRRATEAARSIAPEQPAEFALKRAIGLLLLDEPEGWAVAATLSDQVSTPRQRREVAHRDINLADLAMRWGRYAEARDRVGNARALADTYGYSRYREFSYVTEVHLDWLTGNWDGLAQRARELAEDEDAMPVNRLQASLVTGLLLFAADGRRADAEAVLERVVAQMRDLGAMESLTEPAAALAWLYLAAERVDDALAVTAEPIGAVALKETWLWATELAPARVEALIAAGRVGDAAELVATFAGGVQGRDAPAPEAALLLCEGILADGRGAPRRAATAFARAAEAWDALPRPYDALLARQRRAHALVAAGQRASGLALLAEVFTGLSNLGARPNVDRALANLQVHEPDASAPRGRGRPGYGDRLSPRELEVVRLVIEGRTNPQIAETLVMSRQTVNSHVRSALRKLKVTSRVSLAVSAVELGLISDDDTKATDE
jgi:DNA-binding CsgD family transcriptional regulator/tetratricopeptide (TPR) repeat protein